MNAGVSFFSFSRWATLAMGLTLLLVGSNWRGTKSLLSETGSYFYKSLFRNEKVIDVNFSSELREFGDCSSRFAEYIVHDSP